MAHTGTAAEPAQEPLVVRSVALRADQDAEVRRRHTNLSALVRDLLDQWIARGADSEVTQHADEQQQPK